MTMVQNLSNALRSAICAPLEVTAVPIGYHIETAFRLPDGDALSFYMVEDEDGRLHLEDDGTTVPDAIGRGFDMKSPPRESMLRNLLAAEGVRLDPDLVIRTTPFPAQEAGMHSLRLIAALIRTRDLFIMNRENIAASFAADVRQALLPRLPQYLAVDENASIEAGGADVVLRNVKTGTKAARIYAAGGDLRLMDALDEFRVKGPGDSPVIAVVDRRKAGPSEKRFNRATNAGLPIAVMDGGTGDWIDRVLNLAEAA